MNPDLSAKNKFPYTPDKFIAKNSFLFTDMYVIISEA